MGRTKTAGDQPDDPKEPEWITEARRDATVEGREKVAELVAEVTKASMVCEQLGEMHIWQARFKHSWFSALMDAGFSEHQAMSIILSDG